MNRPKRQSGRPINRSLPSRWQHAMSSASLPKPLKASWANPSTISSSSLSILAQRTTLIAFHPVMLRKMKESRSIAWRIVPCPRREIRPAFLDKGSYIAAADADDVYLPDRLRWGVDFMKQHPEVGVLGSAIEWINASGKPLQTARNPLENSKIQSALLTNSALFHPTVLIRREAFARTGGYRPVFNVAYDYDLWLRIAEQFHIANIEQVAVRYRIHPHQDSLRHLRQQTLCKLAAQASARMRRLGQADPLSSAAKITPALLTELGVSEREQRREVFSSYRHWTLNLCLAGEYASALRVATEILQSDLRGIERWQIADIYLAVAKLWWRQRRPVKGFLAACRAVMMWPGISRRLIGAVFRRLGLTWRPSAL